MADSKQVDRQGFLRVATMSIGGLITMLMGIPAVAYIIGPAQRKTEDQNWISIGSVSKVELGVPTLFKARIQRQAGWIVDEQELSMYVYTENGRDFIALSNVCTHLGCRVRWVENEENFFCPCHNAVFSQDGTVVSGPPPEPLSQYEIKIEDDQIFVLGG